MTKRFAHIRQLVALRKQLQQSPVLADELMHTLIVESLPPAYLHLYRWIVECDHSITSNMVMLAWNWQANMASTALNELWQFGLLKREEYRDEHGKGYQYTIAD